MTKIQYKRWKDFSIRMARTCFVDRNRPGPAWIARVVEDWFDRFDEEDIPGIVSWDHSKPYPKKSRYYRKAYRCQCWHCSKAGNDPADCRYGCEGGKIYDFAQPGYVCDRMSEFLDDWKPRTPRCKACEDWHSDDECRCDEIEELFHEQWDEQWGAPVRCCVRAGLDLASSPSAGVVGFSVGDLRRMYPEGLPGWITKPKDPWVKGPLGGPAEPFDVASAPDEMGIWL